LEIPEISIPEISIPNIHIPYTFSPTYDHSNIQVIGCKYYHRDTKNTGNRNLLIDDPRGVVSDCPFPSFSPLQFVPDQLIIVEETAPVNKKPDPLPEGKKPKTEIPKEEKKEEEYKPCPPKNAPFRQGDFKNELRLERLLKYERSIDGSCNAVWEKVPFIDQYIPQPSTIVSTAVIASVAAVTPLLLSAVKPLVKQLIKRIAKVFEGKKNKVR
tara:strand:- start:716 stop:1354 length:639 start_codon:yes stop_codon:yes gene_type:complete